MADDKNVGQPCGKFFLFGVSNMDDVESTVVSDSVSDFSNTADIISSSDISEIS